MIFLLRYVPQSLIIAYQSVRHQTLLLIESNSIPVKFGSGHGLCAGCARPRLRARRWRRPTWRTTLSTSSTTSPGSEISSGIFLHDFSRIFHPRGKKLLYDNFNQFTNYINLNISIITSHELSTTLYCVSKK